MKADINVARDLLLASLATDADYDQVQRVTEGRFKRIGSGAYRTAYLHEPSGVVYKIDHSWNSGGGNKEELEAIEDNRDAFPYVGSNGREIRLAAAEGFRFGRHYVVAMEYAPEGAYDLGYNDTYGAGEWFGLTDVAGSNIRIAASDGAVVITDAGLSSAQRRRKKEQPQPLPEPDGPRWVQEYAFA